MKASPGKSLLTRSTIVLLGATAFAAPFLSQRFAALSLLATLPWLLLILSPARTTRGPLIWFLALVYLSGILALNWLGSFSYPALLISPVFYLALFLPLFYLTRWLRGFWPSLPVAMIWGLTFTGTEWVRIRLSAGEIPFCQLGAALVPFTKLIQLADVTGAAGLSTIAAVTTGFVFDAGSFLNTSQQTRNVKTVALSGCLVVAIFIVAVSYGYWNDRPSEFSSGPRLAAIQSNMPGWRDDRSSRLKVERAIELTESNATNRSDVDLVVWPENSVVPNLQEPNADAQAITKVAEVSARINLPVLIDGPFEMKEVSERHRVALVQPDGSVTTYAKQLFVPWSEYAPFESTLRSFSPTVADGYLRFIKSRNPYFTPTLSESDKPVTVFRYQGRNGQPVIFGSPVCYEVLSPRLVNHWYAALNENDRRAFFLINQVNEILVGDSVHQQTLALSQLRAVEGRVSVLRATNNGISAAIDPNGRVYDRLADPVTGASTDVAGVFFPQVRLDSRAGRTIYARFGDWWPIGCLITSLTLAALGYLRRRNQGMIN